jgi:hypothetical protein
MSVVDFSHYQKQKKIFSVIEQIQSLIIKLDSVEKIEQLKNNLNYFHELKHGNNSTIKITK